MPLEQFSANGRPLTVRHGSTPEPSIAGLPDREIHIMDRESLIEVLNRLPSPCLERRVKRRLMHFDALTLRRLLFLCRRCERNLVRLQERRPVPMMEF